MKQPQSNDEKILAKLDRVITLLEDLFILEAAHIGVNKAPLREILRIDKRRIGRIAKHVQSDQDGKSTTL
jgi:hypothetical protein